MIDFTKILPYLGYIISFILLIIIILMPKGCKDNIVNTNTDTTSISITKDYKLGDTITKHDTITIHKTKYKPKVIHDTIIVDSSNNTLYTNHFRTYNDTIKDSLNRFTIVIKDSIKGELISRKSDIIFVNTNSFRVDTIKIEKIVNITKTIEIEDKVPVHLGFSAGIALTPAGVQPYIGFGINVGVKNLKNKEKKTKKQKDKK